MCIVCSCGKPGSKNGNPQAITVGQLYDAAGAAGITLVQAACRILRYAASVDPDLATRLQPVDPYCVEGFQDIKKRQRAQRRAQ